MFQSEGFRFHLGSVGVSATGVRLSPWKTPKFTVAYLSTPIYHGTQHVSRSGAVRFSVFRVVQNGTVHPGYGTAYGTGRGGHETFYGNTFAFPWVRQRVKLAAGTISTRALETTLLEITPLS